jgi:hypothetical protein
MRVENVFDHVHAYHSHKIGDRRDVSSAFAYGRLDILIDNGPAFSAVASCNDLAKFASHRVSSLARNKGTQLAHSCDIKARAFRFIE